MSDLPPETFRVIYRDEWLVVLDKPSGLLAVPGRGPDLHDCLSSRVQAVFPEARVVHRLDRDTSGAIVMALDAEVHRILSKQFADRTVEKRYIAVVRGSLDADEGTIDLPMRKDFDRPPRHRIDLVLGKPATTCWRVLDRSADRCRLELRPITGRSHQIRLHLATIGNPILGDNLYADQQSRLISPRLLLHAERLSLAHPANLEPITWEIACPF